MKKLIFLAIMFFVVPQAMAVTLSWDANTDSAIGYKVYYQATGSETINSEIIPGRETVTYTIDNNKFMPGVEYSFWLTAHNLAGESGTSNVVTWTAPEFIPTGNPAPVIINIPAVPVTINIGN